MWGDGLDKIKAIAGSIGIYGAGTLITGLLFRSKDFISLPSCHFHGESSVPYLGFKPDIHLSDQKIQGNTGQGVALSLSGEGISMAAMPPVAYSCQGALIFGFPLGIENWFR